MSNEDSHGANGHGAAVPPGMLMVPMAGKPSDIILANGVAAAMLGNLLDRDGLLFTVLLGEAMTGNRLAKRQHRAGPAELAEREASGHG